MLIVPHLWLNLNQFWSVIELHVSQPIRVGFHYLVCKDRLFHGFTIFTDIRSKPCAKIETDWGLL